MDRAKALAWQLERALLCPSCGLPLDETTDPDNEGRYTAQKIRCHACHAKGVKAESQGENDDRHGLLFPVHHDDRR